MMTFFDGLSDVFRKHGMIVAILLAVVVVAVLLAIVVVSRLRRQTREGLTMPNAGGASVVGTGVVGTVIAAGPHGYTVSYTFNGKPMTYTLDQSSYTGLMLNAGSNGIFMPMNSAALGIKMYLTLTSTGTVVSGGQVLGAFGTIPNGATLKPTSVVVGTVQNPTPAQYTQFSWVTYVVSYTFGGQTKFTPLYLDSPSAYTMYGLNGTQDIGKKLHLTLTAFGDVISISK